MSRKEADQHAYYREKFTELLNINQARAEEIQALSISTFEKITLLERELGAE